MADPLSRLSRLQDAASRGSDPGAVLLWSFVAIFTELFYQVARTIEALFSIIIVPTESFIDGIGMLILAIIGGAARIVGSGAESTAQSLLVGIWSALGPFNYPIAIASIITGAWLLVRAAREQETSDAPFLLFSGTDLPDIPIIGRFGVEEEDEEGDE